ncbi:MAG: type II toxin-antitoxin system RelE/ParE family toxin [Lachnospiraceae bacterium]|nr:type II toxin-antitoxin system RelE/ParE family toxin [Lachnospiraceae bacterium]
MFQIIYSKKAVKFLQKLDRPTQKRLVTAISKLPLVGDIKKLQGVDGYRLRVGNFRVLFDVNGIIIDIIEIGNRGDIYKGV